MDIVERLRPLSTCLGQCLRRAEPGRCCSSGRWQRVAIGTRSLIKPPHGEPRPDMLAFHAIFPLVAAPRLALGMKAPALDNMTVPGAVRPALRGINCSLINLSGNGPGTTSAKSREHGQIHAAVSTIDRYLYPADKSKKLRLYIESINQP